MSIKMLDTLVNIKGGNPGGRRKYFLNDETTAKKLKRAAAADNPNIVIIPRSGSTTIRLSTGSYILTALPLLKAWLDIEGAYINQEQVDGMIIGVDKVKTIIDLGGTIERYEVKLIVEGQEVTVTLYDTTLSIFVQAGSMLNPYCNRVLIPYLNDEIQKASKMIEEMNIKIRAVIIPKGTTRWQKKESMKKASILELPSTLSSPRLRTLSSPVTSVLALPQLSPCPPPSTLQQGSTEDPPIEDPPPSSTAWSPPSSPVRTPGLLARAASWLPEVLSSPFLPSPRYSNQKDQQATPKRTPLVTRKEIALSAPSQETAPMAPFQEVTSSAPFQRHERAHLEETAPDPQETTYPLLTSAGRLAMADPLQYVTVQLIEETAACYPCQVCDSVFSLQHSLTDHIENVHTGNISPRQIHQESSLLTASGRPILLTPNFASKHTKLMKNFNLDHDDNSSESDESEDEANPFKCDVCEYEVNNAAGLRNHNNTNHKHKYACEKCRYQAANKNDLVGHIHNEHQEYITPCTVCGENQMSISSLQVHILNNHCTQTDSIIELLKRQEQMVAVIQQQINYIALKQTCVIGDIKDMKQNQLHSHPPDPSKILPSSLASISTTAPALVPTSLTGPRSLAQPLMDAGQVREAPAHPETYYCKDCSYKCSSLAKLNQHTTNKHMRLEVVPPTYAEQVREAPAHAETYNCNDCRYKCSSLAKLDQHITNKHMRPNHGVPHTLFVCDSRVKSLKARIVEKALRNGRLSVPGSLKVPEGPQGRGNGHPGRAYCSARDWPGAKFPTASLEDKVPELLAARPFVNLVLQAPCNDITNILTVKDQNKHLELAALSAHNTLAVVERALRVTPSLKKVVILEQLPRADSDHLCALAQHSTAVLRDAVSNSSLKDRIMLASSKSLECGTEQKIVDLFGARDSPRSDGVHLAGEHGRQLYTDFVLDSIKSANLAGTSNAPRASPSQQGHGNLVTGNKFGPLSN